jgi:hypothetical protein
MTTKINNSAQSFLDNKLKALFNGIQLLHESIKKNLIIQVFACLLITASAFYFSASMFFTIPYMIISIVAILITLPIFLTSLSASEAQDNYEEIKEAFESSKQVLSDAKQLKTGKEVNDKSLLKNLEFISQLSSLPGLSTDAIGNVSASLKLLSPLFAALAVLSYAGRIMQIVAIVITALVLIF